MLIEETALEVFVPVDDDYADVDDDYDAGGLNEQLQQCCFSRYLVLRRLRRVRTLAETQVHCPGRRRIPDAHTIVVMTDATSSAPAQSSRAGAQAMAVDELGEDLVDTDMTAYIRPPITSTAKLATGTPCQVTENNRQITSGTAQTSRQGIVRTDKPCAQRPYEAFQRRAQSAPRPSLELFPASQKATPALIPRRSRTRA